MLLLPSEVMNSLMHDGYKLASQCTEGGLLRMWFCDRRLSVAGVLCARSAIKFPLASSFLRFSTKQYQVSGYGIGESLRTCCLCHIFVSALPSGLHHITLIYQRSGGPKLYFYVKNSWNCVDTFRDGTSPRSIRQTLSNASSTF